MHVSDLRLHSKFCKWQWILKPIDDCDLINELISQQLTKDDIINTIEPYSWHIEPCDEAKSDLDISTFSGTDVPNKCSILPCNAIATDLLAALFGCMQAWTDRLESANHSYIECFTAISKYIRDAIYLNLFGCMTAYNGHYGPDYRGIYGFEISSFDSQELYSSCLEFCKGAFWLGNDTRTGDNGYGINVIDLSDYILDSSGLLLWYDNSGNARCCCCNICQFVKLSLDQNDNIGLIEVINEHPFKVLEFLQHNRKWKTLEYQLIAITLEAYFMLQSQKMAFQSFEAGTSGAVIRDLLENCGCFVILKDMHVACKNIFESLKNNDHLLNTASIILDLINEYTQIWEQMNLQVFLFNLSSVAIRSPKGIVSDSKFQSSFEFNQMTIVDFIPYLEYRFHVNTGSVMNLDVKRKWLHENVKGISESDLREILVLTQGYTFQDLLILTRAAKCEALRHFNYRDSTLDISNCEGINCFNRANMLECFKKAVAIRRPINLLANIPSTCHVISPNSDGSILFGELLPLVNNGLKTSVKKGLESMVFKVDQLNWIHEFLNEVDGNGVTLLLVGPSGSGKTSFACALAHEMQSVLIVANILDFIRPQVGYSEILIHDFVAGVRNQFSSCIPTFGSRREYTRCILLLKGLESLRDDDAHYIQRIVSTLCAEIDIIISQALWNNHKSILLICTATSASRLPSKLISHKRFDCEFTLDGKIGSIGELKQCLELYLNCRCLCMDKLDEVCNLINGSVETYSQVALLCKNAALKSATRTSEKIGITIDDLISSL
ncbi:bifunctional AAA+ ATPase domain/P-loop containing nucleoside triphosphate hydrolase/ATPase [Babesia duncani]|uniref:Bifunctional AAA+ ATPase domain/P-loop containing nucleoside triphosphate hydrolase/ATPase n=1 Tax=Babesia duncani TaxID=323732 RepID=A0AAD9PK05_9APIC|nr:bifunctional AAA+ ATPase domain/P-loop containing nucleoside triphosphate hydrolase/ATPase [Babesia duncani]